MDMGAFEGDVAGLAPGDTVGAEPAAAAEAVQAAVSGHVIDMGSLDAAWAGQTITIRPHLSFAADQRITQASAGMRLEEPTGNRRQRRQARPKTVIDPDPLGHAAAVIGEAVLSWTLRDVDGRPLECSPSVVHSESVPARLMQEAIDAIMDHYHPEDDDAADPTGRS